MCDIQEKLKKIKHDVPWGSLQHQEDVSWMIQTIENLIRETEELKTKNEHVLQEK